MQDFKQSEFNIGTLGHVDHGKTTLTKAITGVWTDRHSESLKRSMTIKLGYADAIIKKCQGCEQGPGCYTVGEICEDSSKKPEPFRRVSMLDSPGHETLMATAIAGSNIIDAVMFVISATEPCPMPQTKEHLMLISTLNIPKIIVVQTKIDIVGKERAKQHYDQITKFLRGSIAEKAPIVPVMANKNINVDAVLEQIAKIDLPKHDITSDPMMYIARSFDVNRPGSPIKDLVGGVFGGSIVKGKFKVGEEIEIRPGINVNRDKTKKESYEPVITTLESLSSGADSLKEAVAGGLIAVGTTMDPTFTKTDGLVGNLAGHVGKLPETASSLTLKYHLLSRDDIPKQAFRENEPIILGIGTATTVGYIKLAKKSTIEVELKRPVCADPKAKISILRNFAQRWRLSGFCTIA
ncbi:MAG: translation initiation factor IF-2 subunit gamma [Candidatus Micrarchaeota archaeon]|nr:translation initiation factor IF-2 subunit gamma [Candidatus Micrarchaeota archaeon]MDE1847751.1 translation initiation factor IF-2 subunit gamma [Candidatus Micrarchaeota archaeon]MDE1863894.1 translation initiation factor IF-2 subunit gamma [Candidatus Micrarchaeota archaeon]